MRNMIIAYLFIEGLIALSLLTMSTCQYEELYEELNFLGLIKISFYLCNKRQNKSIHN